MNFVLAIVDLNRIIIVGRVMSATIDFHFRELMLTGGNGSNSLRNSFTTVHLTL